MTSSGESGSRSRSAPGGSRLKRPAPGQLRPQLAARWPLSPRVHDIEVGPRACDVTTPMEDDGAPI